MKYLTLREGEDAETLDEAIHLAIGAASACWERLEGAGVFREDRAREIGRELIEWIQLYATPLSLDAPHWIRVAPEMLEMLRLGVYFRGWIQAEPNPDGHDGWVLTFHRDKGEPHDWPSGYGGVPAAVEPPGEST